ncbi:transcription initiation factor TFIID subunit 9 [Chelonus insularis]|uniref:transcription initiation factor TFIID subunit 9 n=1 Tax=Chelonus insularis TaxID=460826 RepID=UPI00158F3FFF|nr:transcription initiation factor TFIID subunit 9 [Chelonus insularis]
MAEKTKTMNHVKHVPKDAQVIMSIMKDMGIVDYEPKVINQLLEFTYRYITCLLDDSKVFANHAKKKLIDLEDVRLAVKMQLEKTFTNPPPRDVLLEVARAKNNIPLPFVKPNNGLRLPPDRYCLNSANYRLKPSMKKPIGKQMHSLVGNSFMGQSKAKIDNTKGGLSIVKRPGTLTTVARTQTISVPKPVFKFSTAGTSSPSTLLNPTAKPKIQITNSQSASVIKMETDESSKRKREEDDYDVP